MREKEFLPKSVSSAIIASRSSGVVNLAGRGLTNVPKAVYDTTVQIDGDSTEWWHTEQLHTINLARNSLQALPSGLASLETLQVLDASDNELTQLPEFAPNIKVLEVQRNGIVNLDSVARITSLAKLSCSRNALTALPDDLATQQPSLAEVLANGNRIKQLPQGFARASALRKLEMAGNCVSVLRACDLSGLRALIELDLSENELGGCLSEGIGCCTALRVLNLKQNKLEALPPAIGLCVSLVELHLGFNELRIVPDEIGLCDSLAIVDLRNNKLSALGEGLPTLRLKLLDLTNNDLATLPCSLGLMTSLRAIPLMGNPLKKIPVSVQQGPVSSLLEHLRNKGPEEALEGICAGVSSMISGSDAQVAAAAANRIASAEGAHELNLASSNLTEVPPEVWRAGPKLSKLDLSKNRLAHLDSEVLASCTNLQSLCAQHNVLNTWPLPQAAGCLPRLTELNLSYNTPLPLLSRTAFVSCAERLLTLDLSGCPSAAQDLSCLSPCTNLQSLHLARCKLREFPRSIWRLPVQILGLSNNEIEVVPDDVHQLSALDALDVRNNNIRSLPGQLALLPLRSLLVEGNILRTINRSVLDKGTPALLLYLKNKLPA